MTKLEKAFFMHKRENPNKSSFVCFMKTIRGSGMAFGTPFRKLVDKSDYDKDDIDEIMNYLMRISKKPLVESKKAL